MGAVEEWAVVKGFEGLYEVSNMGRVRSVDRLVARRDGTTRFSKGKILKQSTHRNGYKKVSLSKSGIVTYHRVHRLVAEAFIENPDNMPCVNHKDEDKSNNKLSNLEWCSHSYNHLYGSACNKNRKPIVRMDDRTVFSSIAGASRELGVSISRIRYALEKGTTLLGSRWEYA